MHLYPIRYTCHQKGSVFVVLVTSLFCLLISLNSFAAQSGQLVEEPVFQSKVYLEEYGKNKEIAVVLIHGTGELGATIWDSLIADLKESFHVVTFDLPGFGRSEKKNELYSPANYARFVKWVVDKYTKKPVHVVGHSMGGSIALYFAGIFPDALDSLILVDAAGILHRATFAKNMIDNYLSEDDDGREETVIDKPLSALKQIIGDTIENMDKTFMPENIDPLLNSETFRETALNGDPVRISSMALVQTDFSPILGKVKVPTTIIWGQQDDITPLRTGKLLAYNIRKASLTVLENLKHNPMLEDPETFNSLILQSIFEPGINLFAKIDNHKPPRKNPGDLELSGKHELIINGDYKKVVVKDSDGIIIRNVTARSLEILNSVVTVENSLFNDDEGTPVNIRDSTVILTGVHVIGETAMKIYHSSLDIAGSNLKGKNAIIESENNTRIVFSVTKIDGPVHKGFIHKIIRLKLGETF